MAHKKLLAAYSGLALLLLAAGALSIAFSVIWRAPDLLRNIIITPTDLNIGLIIGVLYLVTFAIAVGAIVQPTHVTLGLVVLNWSLLLDTVVTVVVGSIVWFWTLQERANFHAVFQAQSDDTKSKLQDLLSCCGYFNSTDLFVPTGFCQTAVNATPCVGPITADADYTLNNIFSSIYGFMAIIIALFLASMCVIKVREETERFRKIDEKRGGRGFV